MSEPTTPQGHHAGHKFHEVFQLRQGRYCDLPAAKISEMIKSNSLDSAPTQSLLSVVNGILEESIERKSGELPQRVACLLRKVVQEIERRISTQAEHIRNQNNLIKVREEKYQSRIKVLETLANVANTEEPRAQVAMSINQFQGAKVMFSAESSQKIEKIANITLIEMEKVRNEEGRKVEEEDVGRLAKAKANTDKLMEDLERLAKAKEDGDRIILELRENLESAKRSYERQIESFRSNKAKEDSDNLMEDIERLTKAKEDSQKKVLELQEELESAKRSYGMQIESFKSNNAKEISNKLMEDVGRLTKAKEDGDKIILELREDLETAKRSYERQIESFKSKAMQSQVELEQKIKDAEALLAKSRKSFKELEKATEIKLKIWNQKEHVYQNFIIAQSGSLQDLRLSFDSIKQDVALAQKKWGEEVASFGEHLHGLAKAAENYHVVLAENRKLYNEIQELKGNIRVYCRVRPFRPGENKKLSTVEHISGNSELVLANPSKQGKDGHKMFKFNKVFGPTSTQEEVYVDTQPLVRSVLDGYNVCIFAYGQTGSGKTYTMTGPNSATEKEWGVNYRALSDLFSISQNRKGTITYEVGVQMVEIYNEQVRDLLASNGANRKIGILTSSQPNGLAVPDATMLPVTSTSDVLDLMHIGLSNRAVSATALNERSSRSHSIVTIHVRGTDLKGGSTLRGSLHLVDLAGSERVDRSEVTGDRLKEAQHINKSLAALGDVIFALSQKSSHVPYRNSKLTQLLQASLGGHAKTLMFVQVNPDVNSYSETLSTLKFAERVSGVELGAAKSQKEGGKDNRDLMELVASLKETIARKDEEIEQLQHLNDVGPTGAKDERGLSSSLMHSTSYGTIPVLHQQMKSANGSINSSRSASDLTNVSGSNAEQPETGSQRIAGQMAPADPELAGFGDADSEERLSDISDGGLSMGTETDGSVGSAIEFIMFPEQEKPPPQRAQEKKSKLTAQSSKQPLPKPGLHAAASRIKVVKEATKSPSIRKAATSQATPLPSSKSATRQVSSKAAAAAAVRRTWQ